MARPSGCQRAHDLWICLPGGGFPLLRWSTVPRHRHVGTETHRKMASCWPWAERRGAGDGRLRYV